MAWAFDCMHVLRRTFRGVVFGGVAGLVCLLIFWLVYALFPDNEIVIYLNSLMRMPCAPVLMVYKYLAEMGVTPREDPMTVILLLFCYWALCGAVIGGGISFARSVFCGRTPSGVSAGTPGPQQQTTPKRMDVSGWDRPLLWVLAPTIVGWLLLISLGLSSEPDFISVALRGPLITVVCLGIVLVSPFEVLTILLAFLHVAFWGRWKSVTYRYLVLGASVGGMAGIMAGHWTSNPKPVLGVFLAMVIGMLAGGIIGWVLGVRRTNRMRNTTGGNTLESSN